MLVICDIKGFFVWVGQSVRKLEKLPKIRIFNAFCKFYMIAYDTKFMTDDEFMIQNMIVLRTFSGSSKLLGLLVE